MHTPRATLSSFFISGSLALALVVGCTNETEQSSEMAAPSDTPTVLGSTVEVVIRGLSFEAPEGVPSGWVTFVVRNEADMTHFAVIQKLPDGVGVGDQQREVAPVFQQGMDLINAGDMDGAMAKFGELPEWFGAIEFAGGVGLISGSSTATTTVYLEPGTYMLECYVKTDGVFHSYNPNEPEFGMVHEFTVTAESAEASEPEATLDVQLSATGGIVADDFVPAGEHMVAVHFGEQVVHENFVQHDLHVARLEEDTDLDGLAAWMDWSRPEGLQTPAPVRFLGGSEEMPPGSTAYIAVDLEPGRYAWISEVTAPETKGMLKVFAVGSDPTAGSSR